MKSTRKIRMPFPSGLGDGVAGGGSCALESFVVVVEGYITRGPEVVVMST